VPQNAKRTGKDIVVVEIRDRKRCPLRKA